MKRKNSDKQTDRVWLILLSILCTALIAVSFLKESAFSPVKKATGIFIAPVQKGINGLGSWLSGFTVNFSDAASLREENAALQEKVDTLTAENSQLVLEKEACPQTDRQYQEQAQTGRPLPKPVVLAVSQGQEIAFHDHPSS